MSGRTTTAADVYALQLRTARSIAMGLFCSRSSDVAHRRSVAIETCVSVFSDTEMHFLAMTRMGRFPSPEQGASDKHRQYRHGGDHSPKEPLNCVFAVFVMNHSLHRSRHGNRCDVAHWVAFNLSFGCISHCRNAEVPLTHHITVGFLHVR